MSLSIPGFPTLPGGLDRAGPPARGVRPGSPEVGSPGAGSPRDPAAGRLDVGPEAAATQVTADRSAVADVPPGTDPELWAVLTTEERSHFSRLRAMGPLTYGTASGAGSTTPQQARRGVRLDVRA